MKKSIILLLFLLIGIDLLFAQNIKRDPEPGKDVANVFYKTQYTLFDLWSDEPIFPDNSGIYTIYYATNEDKTPREFRGSAYDLSRKVAYKFKNYSNCKNWCDGKVYKSVTDNSSIVNSQSNSNNNIGNLSNKSNEFYSIQNIHQEFNFYDKPLSVIDAEVIISLGSSYAKSEKEKLESLLNGYLDLKKQESAINEKLKKYGNCGTGDCNEKIAFYNYFKKEKKSYEVYDFGKTINEDLLKKISKLYGRKISHSVCSNHKFIKIDNYVYTVIEDNIDNNVCFLQLIEGHRPPKYRLTNGQLIKIIGTAGKNGVKTYKILDKAVKKNAHLAYNNDKKDQFVQEITGLDENYFKLLEEKNEIKKKILSIEKNNFLSIPNLKNDNSYGKLNYIGNTNNGIPNGFGYLLNENKQLVCEAYWDEGFPIVLYKVNNYLNPGLDEKWYRFFGDIYSNKYSNKYILLEPRIYKDKNLSIHNIYIGDFSYIKSDNRNYYNGFGNMFFSSWYKTNLQYYRGYFDNGKRTKGNFYNDEETYDCDFAEGLPIKGKYTSSNKFIYTGELKDWKEHGIGKKVYANGRVEEGWFENGYYKKSMAELEKERLAEVQRLFIEEYKRQEELAAIKRQEEIDNAKRQEEIDKNNPLAIIFNTALNTLDVLQKW